MPWCSETYVRDQWCNSVAFSIALAVTRDGSLVMFSVLVGKCSELQRQ